ncbi:MAG: hypothetical protein MJZ81_07425 [Bacteroidales bacterium]|nr:hypothetical protein [Bacteroidales bacterium]
MSQKKVRCIDCALLSTEGCVCGITGRKVTPFSERNCKKAAVNQNYVEGGRKDEK